MAVYPAGWWYGDLDEEKLDTILDALEDGEPVEESALGQRVILSGTLAGEVPDPEFDLVSLGRYMLRGVAQPQELFTVFAGSVEAEE